MAQNAVDGLFVAGEDDGGILGVLAAHVRVERLVQQLAAVLARRHADMPKLDVVVLHNIPVKERGADARRPVGVHAAVQPDVEPLSARTVYERERFVLDAHAVLVYEVRDEHARARRPGDGDGLYQRVQVGLRAHMRVDGYDAPARGGDLTQGQHLVHGAAGGIAKAERQAASALVQRPFQHPAHALDLAGGRGGARVVKPRVSAQRTGVAHHLRLTDDVTALILAIKEGADVTGAKAAVAPDRRRDALAQAQLAGVRVAVEVAVHVDKPRAHDAAGGVERGCALERVARKAGDPPVFDADIELVVLQRAGVDDPAP